ncbi:MAG: thiamine phosphate synthase [Mariprofundaceae bacterium]|nr:thiamine phosphate synthase [Mariprofundaceae bacterium]
MSVIELPQLTLITQCSRLPSTEAFFSCLQQALDGGVKQVLVRENDMDSSHLLSFSSRVRTMTNDYQAKLIIHSQADIAQAVGADGVHVSRMNMGEIPAIRQWFSTSDILISAACHNLAELKQAEHWGADYVFLSPVFPTKTHPESKALGVDSFEQLAASSSLPVIALGGIDEKNRSQLARYPVAVIGALLDAENPKLAAQHLSLCS